MSQIQLPDTSTVTSIDLARLAAKDGAEVSKLLQAAEYPGFFYLDFRNEPATKEAVEQARGVYSIADAYFDQPTEDKIKDTQKDQPASSDRGYKSCETDESFEMSTDEMRSGTLQLPASMAKQAQLLNSFHSHCHDAAHVVLAQLATALNLPLQERHRADQLSESGLKLIFEPSVPRAADVVENKHRDSGTLTLLFYDTWSLHVCLSGNDDNGEQQEWVFVPPPPEGCALVHGASSLRRLSAGRLRAPLHRVTQPSDGAGKRYFLSYFLRPENRLLDEWAAAAVA